MPFTFQSTIVQSGKYRADIDGLRALAVLPVIFYHAKIAGFSGGFVGVDIFYVISGYLITSLIVKEGEARKFSLVNFYERRVRRIFPAVFVTVFFCAIVAAVLFTPKDLSTFGKSMFAMTFFASNIFFRRFGGPAGYFGNASEQQVLLHTWSLSVEEQFYLFFPALLLLFMRFAQKRAAQLMAFMALGSFAISLWEIKHSPVSAFFILIPRAWELLIGALLALKVAPSLNHRWMRELAGVVGLAIIAWTVIAFNDATVFPGWNALLPCVGAWLIIYAGEGGPSWVKTALSFQPLVFIGLISYSLYLWHWPLIVFARYYSAADLTGIQTTVVILVSILIAFFSFEFIEAPFRGKDSAFNRNQIISFGLAVSLVSAAAGLSFYASHGLPSRYSAATAKLVAANIDRKDDYEDVCKNWKKEIHKESDMNFCVLGPSSSKKIMFWGDSHIQQLYPLITSLYEDGELRTHGVVMAMAESCPPAEHLNLIRSGYHCDAFAHFAMQRANQSDVDTVFIGFSSWWAPFREVCLSVDDRCVRNLSPDQGRASFLGSLANDIRIFKTEGKRVIVSLPFPLYDKSIPDLEIRNAVFGRFGITARPRDITPPAMRSGVLSVVQSTGADVFDPRLSLCDETNCLTEVNGLSIYKDSNHLAASQVSILRANLEQALRPHVL